MTTILPWLALVVIILLQAQPFTYGYRRSADEVAFLAALANGWHVVEDMASSLAVFQGRLGLLATVPLNVLGAYLSGDYLARWTFVLLHFGVFVLFAAYFSVISETKVTRPLLIFLISLQAIGGRDDYMPPIAYPLQNTLPILALLAARCAIVAAERRKPRYRYLAWPARLVFVLAMLTTEFAFLLATALLAAEYCFALAHLRRHGVAPTEALRGVVRRSAFAHDVAMVAVALLPYLVFRWTHPSQYVGNVIDAGFEVGRVVETTARHVLAGTAFARDVFDIHSVPLQTLPTALLIAMLTAISLMAVLHDVRHLRSPFVIALGSVLAMAYVAFPLAGNARQQVWCVDQGACGYLDSRITYLGFSVAIICVIAWLLRHIPNSRAAISTVAVISGATGLIAAATYAHNVRDGEAMIAEARSWERAALLACNPDEQPTDDRQLLRLIDPSATVRFHPGFDKAKFWRDYGNLARKGGLCPRDSPARQAELLRMLASVFVVSGQTIQFRDESAGQFLGTGWSQQESWGVWSDADHANLAFLARFAPGIERGQLHVVFQAYIRPSVGHQTISVSVNGRQVDTWTIIKAVGDKGCCERTIDLGRGLRSAEEIDISFHIRNPRNPVVDLDIADPRRLGLFLQTMTLTDAVAKGR